MEGESGHRFQNSGNSNITRYRGIKLTLYTGFATCIHGLKSRASIYSSLESCRADKIDDFGISEFETALLFMSIAIA